MVVGAVEFTVMSRLMGGTMCAGYVKSLTALFHVTTTYAGPSLLFLALALTQQFLEEAGTLLTYRRRHTLEDDNDGRNMANKGRTEAGNKGGRETAA